MIVTSVVDNEVSRNGTKRSDVRRRRDDREGQCSQMDSYTAMKMIEYNQQELARLRGQRNWVSLFRK